MANQWLTDTAAQCCIAVIAIGICLERQKLFLLDHCTDLRLTDFAWHSLVVPWISVARTTEISWTSGSCCQDSIHFLFTVSDWSDGTSLAQDGAARLCQFLLLIDRPPLRSLFPQVYSQISAHSDMQSGRHSSLCFTLSLHDQITQLITDTVSDRSSGLW